VVLLSPSKSAGNFLKETAEAARLFEYFDDDYNHLDIDDLNEDERRIKNVDSKKRVKVGRRRGNLIAGGPVVPNDTGLSVADAYEAKNNYLTELKKFRDATQRESLRAGKGSTFDDNDYMGDLTPMLRPMTQVNLECLKLGQTFPQG
jgi:hypothetical protein